MSRLLHFPHHYSHSNGSIKGWVLILPADTSGLVTTTMRATSREVSICWRRQGTLTTRKKKKLNILTLTLPVHHHDAAAPINMIQWGPFHNTSCRKLDEKSTQSGDCPIRLLPARMCFCNVRLRLFLSSHTEKMQPKLGFVSAQRCSKRFSFYCQD